MIRTYFEKYIRDFYTTKGAALLLYLILYDYDKFKLYENKAKKLYNELHPDINVETIDYTILLDFILIFQRTNLESISKDISCRDFYWWMHDLMIFKENKYDQ